MPKPIYAAVSCRRLNRFGLLRAEVHGKRGELQSKNEKVRKRLADRIREDFDPTQPRSVGWARGQDDHTEIRAAWEAHLAKHSAKPWGSAPRALHLLAHISPEWLPPEHLHDPDHHQVKAILQAAEAWADDKIGGVFAVRMDLDERSCAQVDVFCAPVFPPPSNQKSHFVMPNKSLSRLQAETQERKSFSALQTSWAAWCQKHLDPSIERGERKEKTGREHVHADKIRAAHETIELQLEGQASILSMGADNLRAKSDATKKHEERQAEKLRKRTAALDEREEALTAREAEVTRRESVARRMLRAARELRAQCRAVLEWCASALPWRESAEVREYAAANMGMEVSPPPEARSGPRPPLSVAVRSSRASEDTVPEP